MNQKFSSFLCFVDLQDLTSMQWGGASSVDLEIDTPAINKPKLFGSQIVLSGIAAVFCPVFSVDTWFLFSWSLQKTWIVCDGQRCVR